MLILLCKYPIPGQVKTRLGKSIGMEAAACVQTVFLQQLIQTHRDQSYPLYIWLRQPEFKQQFATKFGIALDHIYTQQGDSLGEIIAHAIDFWLQTSKKVAVIGSDTPNIRPAIVERSLYDGKQEDICIGPTNDGWYYLMSTAHPLPETLIHMPYSHEQVYTDTVKHWEAEGIYAQPLPALIDIDTLEDLHLAMQKFPEWDWGEVEGYMQTL